MQVTIEPGKSLTMRREQEEGISRGRRGKQQREGETAEGGGKWQREGETAGRDLGIELRHEKDKGSGKVFGPSRKSHPHQDPSGIWFLVTKEFDL